MFGRKKESKKLATRKYGQSYLKHSTMGKRSCWLAGISLGILVASIVIAFVMRGKTIGFVGGMGVLAVVLAGAGAKAAMKGFRERERNYLTCRIGMTVNILILLGLIGIFVGGLLR